MPTLTKSFKVPNYRATIDATLEVSDTESHCYLECRKLSATLEAADAVGGFEEDNGTLHIIPQETLTEIRTWAEANGY